MVYISIFISLAHCLLSLFLHLIPVCKLVFLPQVTEPTCTVMPCWPFHGCMKNRHSSGCLGLFSSTSQKAGRQGRPCFSVLVANEGLKLYPL